MKKHMQAIALVSVLLMLLTAMFGCSDQPGETDVDGTTTSSATTTGNQDDATTGTDDSSATTAASDDASQASGTDTQASGSTTAGSQSGSATKSTAKTTNKTTAKTTTKKTTTTKKDVVVQSGVDLKGAKIRIASLWSEAWIGPANGKNLTNAQKQFKDTLATIEKEYNCVIDLFQAKEASLIGDVVTSFSGGTRYADIIETAPVLYYTLVTNKSQILMPLDDNKYIDIKSDMWFEPAINFTTFRGKTYGVFWYNNFDTPLRMVMFFNKDLMKQYGQPDIYDMVKKGTWTFDAFQTITQDVYKKSGNKVSGLSAFGLDTIVPVFAMANDGEFVKEVNGKYTFQGLSNETQYALQWILDFKNMKGNWHDRAAGDWTKTLLTDFYQGKILFMMGDFNVAQNHLFTGMKADYGVVPVPKGPSAKEYRGYNGESRFFCFIKGTDTQYNNASLILNAIVENTYVKDWKTLEKQRSVRDNESVEMLEIVKNNPSVDVVANCLGVKDQIMPKVNEIMNGSATPQKGMETIAKKAQQTVDDWFNK